MAIDLALLKPENFLATSPSKVHTVVPTAIARLGDTNVYEYTFPNSWPETGNWIVSVNSDGLSLAKGTAVGSMPITQGTFYRFAFNWAASESVEALSVKVTALETANTTAGASITSLDARATALETANADLGRRVGVLETSSTDAVTRLEALEQAYATTDNAVQGHTTQIGVLETRGTTVDATIAGLTQRMQDLERQVTALTPPNP